MEDDKQCFICLGEGTGNDERDELGRHCACPTMYSHRSCLTRWQLQNAGKPEEKECRFCKSTLGDWRSALKDVPSSAKKSPAIMAVVFQGKTIKVPVITGPEGVAEFKRTVCKLFNLPDGTEFDVTFECKAPVYGDKLHLKGFQAFEAASYCAAVSAAKRATHKAAKATAGSSSSSTTTTSNPTSDSSTSSSSSAAARARSSNPGAPAASTSPASPAAAPLDQPERSNSSSTDQSPAARLMRCLTQGLMRQRNPSNLRHASNTSNPNTSAADNTNSNNQGSNSFTQSNSSGTSTPTATVQPKSLSLMRRLLCTSIPAPSTDPSAPYAASSGAEQHTTDLPRPPPIRTHVSSFAASRPLATNSTGPAVPDASYDSVSSPSPPVLSAAGSSASLLEPASPAHSLSAAHHDHALPAAHVATTGCGSSREGGAEAEAKPPGVEVEQDAREVAGTFRRVC